MPEIRTVTTLRRKREEIRRGIIACEERLSPAKGGLSHVSATINVFEGSHRPNRAAWQADGCGKARECQGWGD